VSQRRKTDRDTSADFAHASIPELARAASRRDAHVAATHAEACALVAGAMPAPLPPPVAPAPQPASSMVARGHAQTQGLHSQCVEAALAEWRR
jgi:hypothetical protein